MYNNICTHHIVYDVTRQTSGKSTTYELAAAALPTNLTDRLGSNQAKPTLLNMHMLQRANSEEQAMTDLTEQTPLGCNSRLAAFAY